MLKLRAIPVALLLLLALLSPGRAEFPRETKARELSFYEGVIEKVQKLQEVVAVLPREVLFDLIKKEMERQDMGEYVDRYPGFFFYVVDVLRHPTVLVNFLKALSRLDYWAFYGIVMFLSFLVLLYYKRKNRRRRVMWFNRFAVACLLHLGFMGTGGVCFYVVFYREIGPFIELAAGS